MKLRPASSSKFSMINFPDSSELVVRVSRVVEATTRLLGVVVP